MPINSRAFSTSADGRLQALPSFPPPDDTPDSYFALLSRIMDEQSPTLPEEMPCSDEFAEFTSVCLDKEPNRRPTARDQSQPHPEEWRGSGGAGL